jgi:parvulin-like peptidyl-prolyl isomerase
VTAAFAAPVGQMQGPVPVGDGAVVFQVTEQKKVTDADVKSNEASYIDMIRSQQARSLRAVLLQKLRKDAKVEVNDQLLQSRTKSQPQQGA